MEKNLIIKQGDTRNAIATFLMKNGEPVDLAGCTVLFYMPTKIIGGYVQIINNQVVYPVEESMVDEPGIFNAEFKVFYPDGRQETFPNEDYIKINIIRDLKE